MNQKTTSSIEAARRRIGSLGGFALVLVLGCIALLVVLAVGFMSSVGTERTAASGFKATVSARQLADAAVSLVQGQINRATTQGSSVAWVSQPGMVRTFDATSGNLINAYKLYSAQEMISGSVSLTADYPPATWADDSAIWTDLNAPVEVDGVKNYPILDPNIDPKSSPEGFSITSAPGVTGDSYQTAPMPTRWLYVLKDGRVVAPTETLGKTATIPGATAASGSNPIMGRIAFWTDDETCKVNINTASEGTYWDVPRTRTNQELAYAQKPPWQKEFQRYPGHPAMTSLSAVFPKPSGETDQTWAEKIYQLVPRVIGGGSQEGTVNASAASATLAPDSDRLYANVGELVFAAKRAKNDVLTQAQIKQAKFFLTAHSRGPETNLFNLPRISCWPVFNGLAADRVTTFDRLIAFCGSTGTASSNYPYYFQRETPDSTTHDISIGRNQELYSYLQYLTSQNIPGFGGNFSTKYGSDRDQILTEIFDYIRCTNLCDDTLGANKQFTPGDSTTPGHGFVAPTRYTPYGGSTTMGFGRAHTLSEAGIGFICNANGAGFLIGGAKPTLSQCSGSQAIKDANDANIDSNKTTNKVLGGTPLKGEAFLDVGYGASKTGQTNQYFDWDDSTSVDAFPQWKGNRVCDFEPWDDLNENGQWDTGEPFYDAVGDGAYRGEAHEPLHDWGRLSSSRPAWPITTSWPKHAAWNSSQWDAFVATRNADTEQNGRYDTPEKYIQAIFVPEFFCAMGGYTTIHPNIRIEVDGLNQLKITKGTTTASLFPDVGDASFATYTDDPNYWGGANFGGNPGWRYFGVFKTSPARGSIPADSIASGYTEYPFIGKPIKITAPAGGYEAMSFTGGVVTLRIYASANGGDLIQTIAINFPSISSLTIPNLVSRAVGSDTKAANWWSFSRSGAVSGSPGRLAFINKNPGTIYGGLMSGSFFFGPNSATVDPGTNSIAWLGLTDVVRTVMPRHGDYRLVAATPSVPAATYPEPTNPGSAFYKHRTEYDNRYVFMSSTLGSAGNTMTDSGYNLNGKYISTVTYPAYNALDIPSDATQKPESTGDYDNCLPPMLEGPFINKPDEGSDPTVASPYFNEGYTTPRAAFFSPNRQMPSPGMFGSLPTGVKAGIPWRTLLFRHQPDHFGATAPADHLLLDLFWMPVVEPYAISDRFSTAGKINLNYQILPFTYIERSTGLRALFKSELVAAVPNNAYTADNYKSPGSMSSAIYRLPIDSAETLSQFVTKFAAGKVFKSASEICDLDIVPTGQTVASMSTFWNTDLNTGHALTAENLREKIYTTLYPRLTTKSNTYTVHFCVQALKQVPSSAGGTWTDGKDAILGEYRGATTLERFIDANAGIPNYAANPANIPTLDPLDKFYRWRVVENWQFTP